MVKELLAKITSHYGVLVIDLETAYVSCHISTEGETNADPPCREKHVPSKVFVAIQVGVIKWNTFSFQEELEQKISILTYLQKEIKF